MSITNFQKKSKLKVLYFDENFPNDTEILEKAKLSRKFVKPNIMERTEKDEFYLFKLKHGFSNGKHSWRVKFDCLSSGHISTGVCTPEHPASRYLGDFPQFGAGMAGNGYYGEFSKNYYGPKDTVDVLLDLDNKEIQIRKVVKENDISPLKFFRAHDGVLLVHLETIEVTFKGRPVYPCVNALNKGDRVEFYGYKRYYD